MPDQTPAELAAAWVDLWNGDLALSPSIVATDFVSHAAPLFGGAAADNTGRDLLERWISGAHAVFADLRFKVQLGPFQDGDFVILRWKAQGTYTGVLPGTAPNAKGRTVEFYGTDTLRISDGLIREYWANADSLWVVQQIGRQYVPA
ncbi:ester cyclase [Kineosporia babensis]|uniref:Ester cyclase n=1 Tax=Kineosporia babensis TaxID=499548 RepID=A0A9X1NLA9_9ACTN|nr:ester cyclase [Kineosporia babensis]MCD5315183.1 ester cyclase [Kineosporia babensis]